MSTVSSIASGIASSAAAFGAYAIQDAQFKAVDAWLSDSDTNIGAAVHIGAGLSGEGLSVLQMPLYSPKGRTNNLGFYFQQVFNINPAVAQQMNEMAELFRQPNIEGIVIFTESESTSRTMDISTQPLIVQRATGTTTYVTDNAVPKPRQWTLAGHLGTTLASDHYFVVKPSLLLQRNYLDMCMRTRKPVWFKTYDNTFVLVLIADMQTQYDAKSMNTMAIKLTLHEYVPIEITEGLIDSATAKKIMEVIYR